MNEVYLKYLRSLKSEEEEFKFTFEGGRAALIPIHQELVDDKEFIHMLGQWRKDHMDAYPTLFKITDEGTAKWAQSQLIDRDDRILFMVLTESDGYVGHLGLSNIDLDKSVAEIDSVIRGVNGVAKGVMSAALLCLMQWAREKLQIQKLFLRVFEDNRHAIGYYEKNGFKVTRTIPLHKNVQEESITYDEIPEEENLSVDRTFTVMEYSADV